MEQKTSITSTGEAAGQTPGGTAVEHKRLNTKSTRQSIPPHPGGNDRALIPGERDSFRRQAQKTTAGPDTTVIVHERLEDGTTADPDNYLRSRGIVHRAMQLLEEWKFQPARISSSKIPVDIIAIRKEMTLLVQVISSKKPTPDARTLVRHYAGKIRNLMEMGSSARFRKILMAYSTVCGWKYYDVLPGGLIPAWDLPEIPAS
nr:hypothetical protein [uncultured Methanoregula sp.]